MSEDQERELELLEGRLVEAEDRLRDAHVEGDCTAGVRFTRLVSQVLLLRDKIARLKGEGPHAQAAINEAQDGAARAALVEELVKATRAITLHRPWDTAILQGSKWVENRSWKPAQAPGWIYLHGGNVWDGIGAQIVERIDGLNCASAKTPPGAIGGLIKIGRFLPPTREAVAIEGVEDRLLAWKAPEQIGWVIEEVVRFEGAVLPRASGAQRIWSIMPPALRVAHELLREGAFTHRFTPLAKKTP